jgi:hypothetical protein
MAILVLCFVFRNMPVGVRAGVAALAQIDSTLDEGVVDAARVHAAYADARGHAAAAARRSSRRWCSASRTR